jgi:hypothetical protein
MAGSFIGGCWNEARDETDGGKGVPLKHDPAFRGPIRGKSRLVGCRAAYTPWTVAIAGLVSISYPVE